MRVLAASPDTGRRDVALAAGLTVAGLAWVWDGVADPGPHGLATAAVLALGAALALRRRSPLVCAGVLSVVALAEAAAGDSFTSLWAFVVLLLVAYSVGAHADVRQSRVGLALMLAGVWPAQLIDPVSTASERVFSPLIIAFAPWLAGRLVRNHLTQAAELKALNAELAERRAHELDHATAQERARIARELHDIIAHSLSVMVVQAGAAEAAAPAGPVAESLSSIRRTGKNALGEVRRLLEVTRTDEESGDLRPQPGVARLAPMAEQLRSAGMDLRLDVDPALPALSPGPDLVVFRIVQEALTNTLKHAGTTTAHVRLGYDGQAIEIEALDEGGAHRAVPEGGPGHGLLGMRERLALYGGQLDSGPREGGGWRVHARLPVSAVPQR